MFFSKSSWNEMYYTWAITESNYLVNIINEQGSKLEIFVSIQVDTSTIESSIHSWNIVSQIWILDILFPVFNDWK